MYGGMYGGMGNLKKEKHQLAIGQHGRSLGETLVAEQNISILRFCDLDQTKLFAKRSKL